MGIEGKVTVELNPDQTSAQVTWGDEHFSRFNVKWLRFHCHCDRCWRSFSGMFPLDKTKFPDDFILKSAEVKDEVLNFSTDHEIFEGHDFSTVPLDWLRSYCNCKGCIEKEIERREVSFTPGVVPEANYNDVQDNQGMFELLGKVLKHGFAVLHEVPDEDKILLKIGYRISPIFSATFKENFHYEKSGPPVNPKKLPLHQDMAFYEVKPGVQLLHIRRMVDEGTASRVVDLMDAAETLRKESPNDFNALVRIPATFELKEDREGSKLWYEIQQPHIELDYFGKIVGINWHPALEGPLRVHEKDVEGYCKAHKAFSDILKRKDKQIKLKLVPGDLLILNNHRMAHTHEGYFYGKNDFCAETAYINIDDLKSTHIVLGHKLGVDVVPIKVGNRSSF